MCSDGVTIQETSCKSALTRTGIPGVEYALNPYVGCAHACVYCYASFMTRFSSHTGAWGSWVDAKVNIPDVLEKEVTRLISRQSKRRPDGQGVLVNIPEASAPPVAPTITISSVTDPYQPLEGTCQLTRACLEALARAANCSPGADPGADSVADSVANPRANLRANAVRPVIPRASILTKSALVVRDIPILRDLPGSEVGMTITTLDDSLARLVEPGASPPSLRLQALERLSSESIPTWGFISPVLPYYSDSLTALEAMMKRLSEAGVSRILVDRMNPYPAAVSGFTRVARPEAIRALAGYRSSPEAYLARLKDAALTASSGLDVEIRVLF
ncbi:MAG: radical SAM protein [Clostridia bacterium]|nr:radical SAM protein [Clostridia bacterium]